MEDALRIIAGLEPEQLLERAKALELESEYWRHILADCKTSATALRGVVGGIIESTTSAAALAPGIDPGRLSLVDAIIAANRTAIAEAEAIIAALDGIVSLADGRAQALAPVGDALRRAAGVYTDADDDEPAS